MSKTESPPITNALISVSDKTGIAGLARALAARGINIISTGGTARLLADEGIAVKQVAEITGMDEMMDGRVKTLHPAVHGGILARRDNQAHRSDMEKSGIAPIDMVVVNLYPFAQTLAGGERDRNTLIENIDIGGPAMIRAAAKNHDFVAVVTDAGDYDAIIAEIEKTGSISQGFRRRLAAKAYAHTAHYDSQIAAWMRGDNNDGDIFPREFSQSGERVASLRYGENSHQHAALYKTALPKRGVVTAEQIQGKQMGYNNINDTDAAFELVAEFDRPTIAIIKHANPCGVASAKTLEAAWDAAHRCDPVSAFGGIVAANIKLDAATAKKITAIFTEVIIAPDADEDARNIIAEKPNLRLLLTGGMPERADRMLIKSVGGGFLLQSDDTASLTEKNLNCVTKRKPDKNEIADMLFAMRVAKHTKSNAIIYAKDMATIGIGAGQSSRLDSCRIAARKAGDIMEREGLAESPAKGAVVASDAFFPFADGLLAAAEAGAKAVIQPGGSKRDEEVIAAADEKGLAMVFTGIRHFKH